MTTIKISLTFRVHETLVLKWRFDTSDTVKGYNYSGFKGYFYKSFFNTNLRYYVREKFEIV